MNSQLGGQRDIGILVVDDEKVVGAILERYLSQMGYTCVTALDGTEALEKLKIHACALALCDVRMPGMDGIELLKRIKEYDESVAVIMVTAVDNREVAVEAMRAGAYDYLMKPFHFEEVLIGVQRALDNRRLLLERKEYQRDLERKVEERTRELAEKNDELQRLFISAIESIVLALQAKDEYTEGHSRRVSAHATAIARELSLSAGEVENIRLAALLHDIGKVGTKESILNKPGRLTDEEGDHVRSHPLVAASILEPITPLAEVIAYIKHVHEAYDGGGYPDGSTGDEIPLGARIVAVADVFDAMTSRRPYRPAIEENVVLDHLRSEAGKQFDPTVVKAFLKVCGQEGRS
ncbi:MAG TPA: HD domain-containing phosphohydrolase [Anaerolineae bacterium]|nr:HD domain-containing phosphohydrolase [Anaerolineae bacterium]